MIHLTVQGSSAEVISELRFLLALAGDPANNSVPTQGRGETPSADVLTVAAAEGTARPGRKKAPAADVVIDQAPATATNGLTVDEAREHMKKFAADGNMDQVSAALESFGVKKVSDVDPDAKGAKSEKFAAFVMKIEELVAAKGAA